MRAYKRVLLKYLLALCGQLDRQHCNFPSAVASSHLDPCCPSDDLMPKAHTDDSYTILLQNLFRELDQFQDPRVILK